MLPDYIPHYDYIYLSIYLSSVCIIHKHYFVCILICVHTYVFLILHYYVSISAFSLYATPNAASRNKYRYLFLSISEHHGL